MSDGPPRWPPLCGFGRFAHRPGPRRRAFGGGFGSTLGRDAPRGAVADGLSPVRFDLVRRLRGALAAGTYSPDPLAVARSVLIAAIADHVR